MSRPYQQLSFKIEALDRQIIQALQVDGRAPFSLVGEVLGVSEQTVSRRYRRLNEAGVIRVLTLVDPRQHGQELWMVRVQCRPDSASLLAETLARRRDVAWVSLSGGGLEVVAMVRTGGRQSDDELLLDRLPRTAQVQTMSAYSILHRFNPDAQWTAYGNRLEPDQIERLATGPSARRDAATDSDRASVKVSDDDATLVDVLAHDGRASYRRLAEATGWSSARTTRRVDQLLGSGAMYLDIDLANVLLGFPMTANVWMRVAPSDLETVGNALSQQDEVAFCAALTGPANLAAAVVCRDSADLYRYVTTRISALPQITQLEISPLVRRVKQAGALVGGARLAPRVPTRRSPGNSDPIRGG